MPKFLLILLSLLPLASRASAPNETEDLLARPKVAVVLAGGGAKGLAHIGALKVLEETGIPIDIVVGNSMGSIVGGLYALGYTPQEMDSVVRATDWINLLLDAPDYGNQMLTARKQSERYQLRTALNPERHLSRTGRSGLIHGDNIEKLLRHLTEGTSDTCDFNDFPLPFACNATEVETGAIHEFHSGDLVKAMRASMAIPGVFTPVLLDSVMFVDGFVTNNYPVDVARRMGADIIIGLDLVNNVPAEERYNNLLDLVTHMIDISGTHLYQDNIANTNVYVDIDATGYGAASFGKADIDSLIVRGERRARQLLPQICELRDSLFGIYGNYEPRYKQAQRQRQELLTKIHPHTHEEGGYLRRVRNNYLNSSINLGVRYDNDEYVSMHMSMHLNLPGMSRHAVHMFGRLGQRLKGGVSVRHNFKHQGRMELKYFFEHRDLQYYFHGNRMADATSHHQRTELAYGQNWHDVIVSAGLRYDWHLYQDILTRQLTSINTDLDRVRYFSYFAQAEYNTQNSIYYPMYGSHVEGSLEVITDNLYQYKKQQAIPILQMQWNSAFTLGNSQFTLIPHASTRIILSDGTELPLTLSNVVGGLMPGMKVSHQITMSGMRDLEMVLQDAVITGGLGLQQRMGTSHYIQASVDAGSFSSGILDAFNHVSHTWGAQMGYCYSSMAGPISLTAYWNERTKAVRLMLNVGYCF